VALDFLRGRIPKRSRDCIIEGMAQDFVGKTDYDDAWVRVERKTKHVSETEIAGEDDQIPPLGVFEELVVRTATQPYVPDVLGFKIVRSQMWTQRPRQIFVDEKARALPHCLDLLIADRVRGIGKRGENVFAREFIFRHHLLDRHPGPELSNDEIDGNTSTCDHGLSESDLLVYDDSRCNFGHRQLRRDSTTAPRAASDFQDVARPLPAEK
jgi:hypothetical protein